jgi:PAS domain S-box-containing protein
MEQEETPLDDIFREFQSAFSRADSEEKALLVVKFQDWAEQQMGLLGMEKDRNHSKGRQESIRQDIKTLVESEIRLKGITENIEQVIWVRDQRTGRVLYVSPAFEIVWGRSCESLYADPDILVESVHPEDRVQVMAASPRYDRRSLNQTYRILRPDKSLRWISARTFFIPGEAGKSYNLVCIAQDITDQKEVELVLRKALDRSRELFTISHKMSLARKPEAVLKALMSAHELRSARRAAVLFFKFPEIGPTRGVDLTASWQSSSHSADPHPAGKDLPLWLGESSLYEEPSLWELFQPNKPVVFTEIDSDPRLTPRVRALLLEGQIHTLATFPLVALGDWLGCLLIFYTQEHHFEPLELRHLKVFVDQATITLYNLRLLEVEEGSRHEAERANEIKTRFLAMISHELRTPLTSIIGFTTTLLAEDVAWEPAEQRDFIQTIQREANRLKELIDHLLDLSRLEAGRLPISQEIHSLPDILEDVLPQFHTIIKGHKIILHVPANLPPVFVDPKRIAQVLVNLVGNASIYAPAGTEIIISASVRGSFMQVNVADQGPGIQPEEHKLVFEAFRRGINQVEGLGKGAGLGLAICKGLVEAHGGHIWIKKKNTPGATISFTIPLFPLHSPGVPAGKEKLAEEAR